MSAFARLLPRPHRALLAVLCCAAAAGCRSTEAERPNVAGLTTHEQALADLEFDLPASAEFERESKGSDAIGAFLAEIDRRARVWNNLKLTAKTRADAQKLAALEREVVELARKRVPDLQTELQHGPVPNRAIAAMGLGFSKDEAALGPLVGALLDRDEGVVANALVAIGFLASKDTPLVEIATILESDASARLRINAAYALQRAIAAGARDPDVLPALRGGLADTEGGVRGSCALCLAVSGDAASVDALGDLLFDPVNFVALAAATALSRLGSNVPETRARAARHLADAHGKAGGARQRALQRELIVLSGINLGDDADAWRDWALRQQ